MGHMYWSNISNSNMGRRDYRTHVSQNHAHMALYVSNMRASAILRILAFVCRQHVFLQINLFCFSDSQLKSL